MLATVRERLADDLDAPGAVAALDAWAGAVLDGPGVSAAGRGADPRHGRRPARRRPLAAARRRPCRGSPSRADRPSAFNPFSAAALTLWISPDLSTAVSLPIPSPPAPGNPGTMTPNLPAGATAPQQAAGQRPPPAPGRRQAPARRPVTAARTATRDRARHEHPRASGAHRIAGVHPRGHPRPARVRSPAQLRRHRRRAWLAARSASPSAMTCRIPASPRLAAVLAEQAVGLLSAQGVSTAVAVGYGADGAVSPVAAAFLDRAAAAGITVAELLRAEDTRYWSYVCREPACCPPEGTPYDVTAHPAARALRAAGGQVLPSREDLAATVAAAGGQLGRAMRRATRQALGEHRPLRGPHEPRRGAGFHAPPHRGPRPARGPRGHPPLPGGRAGRPRGRGLADGRAAPGPGPR